MAAVVVTGGGGGGGDGGGECCSCLNMLLLGLLTLRGNDEWRAMLLVMCRGTCAAVVGERLGRRWRRWGVGVARCTVNYLAPCAVVWWDVMGCGMD